MSVSEFTMEYTAEGNVRIVTEDEGLVLESDTTGEELLAQRGQRDNDRSGISEWP